MCLSTISQTKLNKIKKEKKSKSSLVQSHCTTLIQPGAHTHSTNFSTISGFVRWCILQNKNIVHFSKNDLDWESDLLVWMSWAYTIQYGASYHITIIFILNIITIQMAPWSSSSICSIIFIILCYIQTVMVDINGMPEYCIAGYIWFVCRYSYMR